MTQQYEHAFLLIESIQSEEDKLEGTQIFFHRLYEAHLYADSNRAGEASVYLNELNFQDARELAEKCVFKTWSISAEEGKALVTDIKADQGISMNYRTCVTPTTGKVTTHNCLSWCLKHLLNLKLKAEPRTWLGKFIAVPSWYLPESGSSRRRDVLEDCSERVATQIPGYRNNRWTIWNSGLVATGLAVASVAIGLYMKGRKV